MNKITIILTVLIAMTIKANAQIPNGGFENWTATGGYEDPTFWGGTNSYSTGPFYAVTKSTEHYPAAIGNYSVRLENSIALSPDYSGRGALFTGPPPPGPNFPIAGHPTSLTGYYKFAPLNNDTMFISVQLFKNGLLVAVGESTSTASASSWTPFTIPIQSYASADSGSIILAAYNAKGFNYLPHGNSVVYVDNLNFDNLITSVIYRNSKRPGPASNIVNLFNPSSSGISFALSSRLCVSLKAFDLAGREIATLVNNEMMSAGTYTKRWNAGAASSGAYLYRLRAGSSTVTTKAVR
jgi:hypothetical protein